MSEKNEAGFIKLTRKMSPYGFMKYMITKKEEMLKPHQLMQKTINLTTQLDQNILRLYLHHNHLHPQRIH